MGAPHALRACRRPWVTGVTLIELMVVLLVIAVLIGLLVPALVGALRTGREGAERTEIGNLATALEHFKGQYGVYPPSQIVLIENGDYSPSRWRNLPIFTWANDEYGVTQDGVFSRSLSLQYLRRIWPQLLLSEVGPAQLDLDGDGTPWNSPLDFYDWNGDGNPSGPQAFALSGDECLVFFLGGIPTGQYDGGQGSRDPSLVEKYPPGVLGFARHPENPTLPLRLSTGAGRVGPFFEFPSDRLVDIDQNGFWEFVPLRRTASSGYAYFSAYEGAGYRPDDWNLPQEPSGSAMDRQRFLVHWPLSSAYPGGFWRTSPVPHLVSPGPNPYTVGPSFRQTGEPPQYWNPNSFQIISPGEDQMYGVGGSYSQTEGVSGWTESGQVRRGEEDNLTNFAPGKLGASQ
jgi:type II secretory pathway pseudopilin PulG